MGEYRLRDALMYVGGRKYRKGDVVPIDDEHVDRLLELEAIEALDGSDAEEFGDSTVDSVPEGNADEVLDWVGDDPERAARALEVERGRDKPRAVLSEKLEKLAEG